MLLCVIRKDAGDDKFRELEFRVHRKRKADFIPPVYSALYTGGIGGYGGTQHGPLP